VRALKETYESMSDSSLIHLLTTMNAQLKSARRQRDSTIVEFCEKRIPIIEDVLVSRAGKK